jgi:hypothetical protein
MYIYIYNWRIYFRFHKLKFHKIHLSLYLISLQSSCGGGGGGEELRVSASFFKKLEILYIGRVWAKLWRTRVFIGFTFLVKCIYVEREEVKGRVIEKSASTNNQYWVRLPRAHRENVPRSVETSLIEEFEFVEADFSLKRNQFCNHW